VIQLCQENQGSIGKFCVLGNHGIYAVGSVYPSKQKNQFLQNFLLRICLNELTKVLYSYAKLLLNLYEPI
jgi:hypothetical protein